MIFVDGIGLGADDPLSNPFAAANAPVMQTLANGHRWLAGVGQQQSERATFLPLDPRLGMSGRPQSGTGQAAIVTGRNVPALIGRHYGPKPDEATRQLLDEDNLFQQLVASGRTAALLEAYPPPWHRGINGGKRLPASYQYAVRSAGLPFMGVDDLRAGHALSGDWTGHGWHSELGFSNVPLLTPFQAGQRLVQLSRSYDFAFMAHWLTDVVGHRGPMERGVALVEILDGVLGGVLATWEDDEGLVILTSDHGNMEDLSHRRHTLNDVPGLLIGREKAAFARGLNTLADLAPRITGLLLGSDD